MFIFQLPSENFDMFVHYSQTTLHIALFSKLLTPWMNKHATTTATQPNDLPKFSHITISPFFRVWCPCFADFLCSFH